MRALLVIAMVVVGSSTGSAQRPTRSEVIAAMQTAAEFYRGEVSSHGGYVYHYSVDLNERWGEGEATKDQIWVQPPGTPTVGMAYLKAYKATGDPYFLDAATEAANALVYGQLKSGGWTNSVDFNPRSKHVAEYRNGQGRGKNNSSLDDGQTQSALQFLIHVDQALGFRDVAIHEAAITGLDALLSAQYPNGGFPQVWTGPVKPQPILRASYPDVDWRTEGRVKNYWDMYTLNDNVTGYVAGVLIDAARVYEDDRYLDSLRRLGDFLILAQMPDPQPGWAQQYSYEMKPIWARKFEPPAVSGDETQEVIDTLMLISRSLDDPKFLQPIPRAVAWLKQSLLADGQLARYYELRSNRPLYMSRRGDKYELTYDDSNLPDHYGWKTPNRLAEIDRQYAIVRARKPLTESVDNDSLTSQAKSILAELDDQGRWIDRYDGNRLVGQAKFKPGQEYISSQTFSENLMRLAEYVASDQP